MLLGTSGPDLGDYRSQSVATTRGLMCGPLYSLIPEVGPERFRRVSGSTVFHDYCLSKTLFDRHSNYLNMRFFVLSRLESSSLRQYSRVESSGAASACSAQARAPPTPWLDITAEARARSRLAAAFAPRAARPQLLPPAAHELSPIVASLAGQTMWQIGGTGHRQERLLCRRCRRFARASGIPGHARRGARRT